MSPKRKKEKACPCDDCTIRGLLGRAQGDADRSGQTQQVPLDILGVGLIRVELRPRTKECEDPACSSCRIRKQS